MAGLTELDGQGVTTSPANRKNFGMVRGLIQANSLDRSQFGGFGPLDDKLDLGRIDQRDAPVALILTLLERKQQDDIFGKACEPCRFALADVSLLVNR